MKNRFLSLILVAMAVLLLVVYLPLLFKDKLVASDFPYTSADSVKIGFNLPMAWSYSAGSGLGGNKVFSLWSYPVDFLFGLTAIIGLDFKASTLLILVIPGIISSLLGVFYLAKSYGIGNHASFGASAFYLLTTYALLLLDGGQISIFLAYGLFPLSFYFLNLCKKNNFKNEYVIVYSLFIAILSVSDLRFFYLHFLISFVLTLLEAFFFKKSFTFLFGVLKTTIAAIVFWLLINFFWIYPVLQGQGGDTLSYLSSSSQLDFLNFTYLFNSFFLQQPNWPLNSFGRLATPDHLFVLAMLPLPILLYKYRKNLTFNIIAFTFLLGAFLAKGINPPFGWIYEILFLNLPGFSMFRDSSKFFAVSSLFFALLIGYVLNSKPQKRRTSISMFCLLLYLVLLTNPIWRGKMTGVFSEIPNQNGYAELNQSIDDQNSFGRILWLPNRPPLADTSPLNTALDGFALSSKHIYQSANVGTYERFNFLREPSYSKHLLDISSIAYIAYPLSDERKIEIKQEDFDYYQSFTGQIAKNEYLENFYNSEKLNVFRNRQQQNLIYFSPNLYWVLGDQSIFNLIPNSKYIFDYPMIFMDSLVDLSKQTTNFNYGKFVIGAMRDETDLVAQLAINGSDLVGENQISGDYWIKNMEVLNNFREFLNSKYQVDTIDFTISQKALIFEPEGSLVVNNPEGKDNLLIKVFRSPKSGKLIHGEGEIEVTRDNGRVLGGIATDDERPLYDLGSFNWIMVETRGERQMEINFSGGEINMVSDIALVNDESLDRAVDTIGLLKSENRIIDYSEFALDVSTASVGRSVSWQKDSPVSFKINSEIEDRGVIVFSQAYDDKWKLSGRDSMPAYSITNLFAYDPELNGAKIYYSGQDELKPTLTFISFSTFATLLLVSIYIVLKNKQNK